MKVQSVEIKVKYSVFVIIIVTLVGITDEIFSSTAEPILEELSVIKYHQYRAKMLLKHVLWHFSYEFILCASLQFSFHENILFLLRFATQKHLPNSEKLTKIVLEKKTNLVNPLNGQYFKYIMKRNTVKTLSELDLF